MRWKAGRRTMLKVFLVEDETIIREGLRDIIPWQQYGYILVGDAGDGEQALPMIRETRPDVLITDIKMPFMDGLALSSLVNKELPGTKIIIISGYDDFEYARQAIRIGVEQYLLKPITKATLTATLSEVREKIENERQAEDYLEKFRSEVQEYEQFSRRRFFEQVVTGQLSVGEIYEKAGTLGIAIEAQCYNLILYSVQERSDLSGFSGENADPAVQIRDALTRFFSGAPEYLMFRWNLMTYAVLLKGEREKMDTLLQHCIDTIWAQARPYEGQVEWYVAVGEKTERLSGLAECFEMLSHTYSCRHLMREHVLTRQNTEEFTGGEDESRLKNLDMAKIDPAVVRGFLQNGTKEELADFVQEYVGGLYEAAASKMFCQYLMLNVRFTAIAYLESLGLKQEAFAEELPAVSPSGMQIKREELGTYIRTVLDRALELRDRRSSSQGKDMIRQAVEYINGHYTDENLSLKEVAGYTNVSANYFSAVFSQEMQQTFVEYLTKKRMERAKELLRQGDKRSAEIAAEVGYKDPHYFSFVFRKTQGCTPRDYRMGGRRG